MEYEILKINWLFKINYAITEALKSSRWFIFHDLNVAYSLVDNLMNTQRLENVLYEFAIAKTVGKTWHQSIRFHQ